MTKVAIVARNNGYGLSVDSELLSQVLLSNGLQVTRALPRARGSWARFFGKPQFDVVIHLEQAFPNWVSAGRKNWLIPNQERFPERHIKQLRKIDLVLAKTRHAEGIFAALGVQAMRVGFITRDRYLPNVAKDWGKFFHLAGGSTLKGTEDILALWAKHPEWPELVLVQNKVNAPKPIPLNVTLISGYIDDEKLRHLQNECGIHLCPSRSEGWGHYLHEAMSCGAVVVTTDAPPMNEFVTPESGVMVAFACQVPRHLGINFFVRPSALEDAVERILAMDQAKKRTFAQNSRAAFLKNCDAFLQAMSTLTNGLVKP